MAFAFCPRLGVSSVNTTFAAASFRGKQQRKLKTGAGLPEPCKDLKAFVWLLGSRAEEVEDKPKEKASYFWSKRKQLR